MRECERWVWVSLPHATYLLGIASGRIAETPPIARWATGKPEQDVAAHLRSRNATFVTVP